MHLVVLVHGLEGKASDFDFITERIKAQSDRALLCLAPTCNQGSTNDGIQQGATRIYTWLLEIIQNIEFTCELSFICHSLGGLYTRYLIGMLFQNNMIPSRMVPKNYISIATPHLGSRQLTRLLPQSLLSSLMKAFPLTIQELMLQDNHSDGKPLLLILATDPHFITGLCMFRLIAYANVANDPSVQYSTSAIRRRNPFKHLELPKNAMIINENDKLVDGLVDLNRASLEMFVEEMVSNLERLPWVRFAVLTSRMFLGHVDIIVKSKYWNKRYGQDIVDHIVSTLEL